MGKQKKRNLPTGTLFHGNKNVLQKVDYKRNNLGITLIALIITIIVMLILAGVSLSAIVGDNGIINRATDATIQTSIAVLEEYMQQQYVTNYERLTQEGTQLDDMLSLFPEYFYIPSNEGIGGLRYIVDSEGHALYLIKKSGLPQEIADQLQGGNAGEGTYSDYMSLNDVYGITSDLKIYYCENGIESIAGITAEELDEDNPLRKVYTLANNSNMYNLLSSYDANGDEILSAEELKSVREITITNESGITEFTNFYNLTSLQNIIFESVNLNSLLGLENCASLNYVYFKSSTVGNFTSLGHINKLKYLYLYDITDSELAKLCTNISTAEISTLEYLAIVGNNSYICNTNIITSSYVPSSKSTNTITDLSPLSILSDTTKKAVKYLSLQCNNIEGDLLAISEYTNLILLRCEYNNLTTLNGLEEMNSLVYLCGAGNQLGTLADGSGEENEAGDNPGTAIESLANKTTLQQVNLWNNTNLSNVSYFENDTALTYLYLSGCSTNMIVNTISNILLACTDYSLPVKFLDGNIYNVSTYYTASAVTYDELSSDLYNNKTITHLNLEGCTNITNDQMNELLSTMPQLQYLTLRNNSQLTTIDFVESCNDLIELDLWYTSVTDMTLLNDNAPDLRTLRVSNGDDFANIVPTIERLRVGSNYNYWYGTSTGGMCGLNCSSIDVLKKLEEITNLKSLNINQNNYMIGNASDILDFSDTQLTTFNIDGVIAFVYLPTTIINVNMANCCFPIIKESSINLTNLQIVCPSTQTKNNPIKIKEFFDSLKNATNLKTLVMRYMERIDLTSLTNYIYYELPSVTVLNLSGGSSSSPFNVIENLEGIEYFPNLQTLTIRYTSTNLDISAIKNCPTLTTVNLAYCNIQSLSGIESLTNLQSLTLNNNNITGVKELENLTNLTTLNLENNLISDTSTYINEAGETVTYNNLEILANLNSNRNGKLTTLLLSGNDNIINWTPASSLTWANKSGF